MKWESLLETAGHTLFEKAIGWSAPLGPDPRKSFPSWFLIVGGAGALTATVPAAIFLLTAATLFVKNLFGPLFAPAMSDDQVSRFARVMVVALSLISLYFSIYSSSTLVSLLLLRYAGTTQFFPGVVLGLYWKRVTAGILGVGTGFVNPGSQAALG